MVVPRHLSRRSVVVIQLVVASLAAAAVLLLHALTIGEAVAQVHALGGVIAFLVVIMVLAQACAAEGLFAAVGARTALAALGSPSRLLLLASVVAAVVTATLSLDATAVLLTPVLVAAARGSGTSARPSAYAAARLANSASTLLPVSNLTNLLAFSATGLGFGSFAWAMLPVWLVAVALEPVVVGLWFRRDLRRPEVPTGTPPPPPIPWLAASVVLLVLAGFAAGSVVGLAPAWPAGVGALALAAHARHRGVLRGREAFAAANLPFAYTVLCWAVVVAAVGRGPVGDLLARLVPDNAGLGDVLVTALVAMVMANLVNNLPATLLLLPLVAPAGPVAVLALLVGVDVGANLTYAGSLANLLWRTSARDSGLVSPGRDFHLLGALTTPLVVAACAVVLWAWTAIIW